MPGAEPHACPRHPDVEALGACERCGNYFCTSCLAEADRPADSRTCAECRPAVGVGLEIGGWLVFPAIGLVVRPAGIGYALYTDLTGIAAGPAELFPPIALEALMNAGLLVFSLYAAACFFRKRQRTIVVMVALYITSIVTALLDRGIVAWVVEIAGTVAEPDTSVVRSVISGVVWSAYFLQSRRVKDTFVQP